MNRNSEHSLMAQDCIIVSVPSIESLDAVQFCGVPFCGAVSGHWLDVIKINGGFLDFFAIIYHFLDFVIRQLGAARPIVARTAEMKTTRNIPKSNTIMCHRQESLN